MRNKRYAVQFKRKRKTLTNYRKRATMLLSEKPRIVVRRTLRNTIVQVSTSSEKGDRIITGTNSKTLKKYGWKHGMSICTAYLTGYMAGIRAKQKGVKEGILDIGDHAHSKGGRVYAALKGLIDAGIDINHDPEVFPKEERLKGAHIKNAGNLQGEIESAKNSIQKGERKNG